MKMSYFIIIFICFYFYFYFFKNESFSLNSNTSTNSNSLISSNYYQVGSLKSSTITVQSPSKNGGTNNCPSNFPSTIFINKNPDLTSGLCDTTNPSTPFNLSTDPQKMYACHQQIWKMAGCTIDLPPYTSQLPSSTTGWVNGYLQNSAVSKAWLLSDALYRSTLNTYAPVCYGTSTVSLK